MKIVSKIQRFLKNRSEPPVGLALPPAHRLAQKQAERRKKFIESEDTVKSPVLRQTMLAVGISSLALFTSFSSKAWVHGAQANNAIVVPTNASGFPGQTLSSWFNYPYNVLAFGAIGSGISNPASSVYGTGSGALAALQTVYGTTINGVAVALTQELDWLAHQAAIDAATASGGVVYSPGRVYVFCNPNSTFDGSGTLTFPQALASPAEGTGVSWLGDFAGTTCHWPYDLGLGNFAVTCANRTSGQGVGFFSGLWMQGPGTGGTFGSTTCNMQGFGSNDRRSFSRVYVNGFKVGINVVGGQAYWEDVTIDSCYYGIYFDVPQSGNFANMQFTRVISSKCNLAALGVNSSASIYNCQFDGCFLGASPFGILKETNNGNPSAGTFLGSDIFNNTQFENIGNALIGEDNYTTPPATSVISSLNSYDPITGAVSITTGYAHTLSVGNKFGLANVAGAGASGIAALNTPGYFVAASGTVAETLNFTIATGLTLSAVTGGLITTRVSTIYDCQFNYPEFLWDTLTGANFHIPGVPAYAIIDVNVITGLKISGIAESFAWQPGTVAMFSATNSVSGFNFYGDLSSIIFNCTHAASPKVNVLVSPQSAWSNGTNIFANSGLAGKTQWKGQVAFASAPLTIGQVVVYASAGQATVAPSAGSSTEVPAGIVTYVPSLSPLSLIATSGTLPCTTSGSISSGSLMQTGASGAGTTGSGNAPFGVAYSQAGTNSWNVTLRGLA